MNKNQELTEGRQLFSSGYDEQLIEDLRELHPNSVKTIDTLEELIELKKIQELIDLLEHKLKIRGTNNV